ncbi:MAG: alanine racemase [Tissierellia bacterium]|nr:alanine racemase [Tissierellia bacterium]
MLNKIKTNRVIVDTQAIRFNISELKKLIGQKKFYAVVKADAYGLGSVEIAKRIDDLVDGYCVSSIFEALEIREVSQKEILNLGYTQLQEVETAALKKISIAIYDLAYAKKIDEILKEKSLKLIGHIKIDTGHGRLGFRKSKEALDEIVEVSKLSNIKLEGIFSHLATADEDDDKHTFDQKEIFDFMIKALEDRGLYFDLKHLANDAGFIKYDFTYDLVRSGICLYGSYPSKLLEEEGQVQLKNTFSWLSKVSFVKYIEKGASISYGRTFTAPRRMKIATIAVGYADGYKRSNSNKAYVLIKGKKAPVLGRVTMDQTMVDVSYIDDVEIGDDVVLVGQSGDLCLTPDDLALWSDTICYEIMTSISKRVHRIY